MALNKESFPRPECQAGYNVAQIGIMLSGLESEWEEFTSLSQGITFSACGCEGENHSVRVPAVDVFRRFSGWLVNQHEARTIGGGHWADEIATAAEARDLPLLSPPLPKRQAIADATEESRGLDEGDSVSRELAKIYDDYLTELTGRNPR